MSVKKVSAAVVLVLAMVLSSAGAVSAESTGLVSKIQVLPDLNVLRISLKYPGAPGSEVKNECNGTDYQVQMFPQYFEYLYALATLSVSANKSVKLSHTNPSPVCEPNSIQVINRISLENP